MSKCKLLFAITQLFKGGAEMALLNLLCTLSPNDYDVDLVILNNLDLPDAISLVPEIPKWVTVIDPVHLISGGKSTITTPNPKKIRKCLRPITGRKYYDWAFHIGEWSSPEWVATEIMAQHKAVWVHSQLDSANYFDEKDFLIYEAYFEYYIFVSSAARIKSVEYYPQLASKSVCISNIVNRNAIIRNAAAPFEKTENFFGHSYPVVLTCANVRIEKNHLRQVEAMALLQKRGIDFLWLNIGSMPDKNYADTVRQAAQAKQLGDKFLLLGNRENPYPYLAQADIVAVLSDYESWSMVITEALVLGRPVLATKTSGALAQITPENGILVNFSAESIADGLQTMLQKRALMPREQHQNTTQPQRGLTEFEHLVRPTEKRSIVYLMDDINYQSGVQTATFTQMRALCADYNIAIYSPKTPQPPVLQQCPCAFVQASPHRQMPNFYLRGGAVLGGAFPLADKLAKLRQIFAGLLGRQAAYEARLAEQALHTMLEDYDNVVVPSEGSALRTLASQLQYPKKIQWIHTDYAGWHNFDAFAQAASCNDGTLYQKFDAIVTLSPRCRDSFIGIHPALAYKTIAIENLLDQDDIDCKSAQHNWFALPTTGLRLITIGRLEAEKNHKVLLATAKRMQDSGIDFCWYMVGGGTLQTQLQQLVQEYGLQSRICFTGQLPNPYPLLAACDVLVLFSHYEGTPVTIREAQLLCIPTVATAVGGIPDLIDNGCDGLLVSDAEDLYTALCQLAQDSRKLAALKESAAKHTTDTAAILAALHTLFD